MTQFYVRSPQSSVHCQLSRLTVCSWEQDQHSVHGEPFWPFVLVTIFFGWVKERTNYELRISVEAKKCTPLQRNSQNWKWPPAFADKCEFALAGVCVVVCHIVNEVPIEINSFLRSQTQWSYKNHPKIWNKWLNLQTYFDHPSSTTLPLWFFKQKYHSTGCRLSVGWCWFPSKKIFGIWEGTHNHYSLWPPAPEQIAAHAWLRCVAKCQSHKNALIPVHNYNRRGVRPTMCTLPHSSGESIQSVWTSIGAHTLLTHLAVVSGVHCWKKVGEKWPGWAEYYKSLLWNGSMGVCAWVGTFVFLLLGFGTFIRRGVWTFFFFKGLFSFSLDGHGDDYDGCFANERVYVRTRFRQRDTLWWVLLETGMSFSIWNIKINQDIASNLVEIWLESCSFQSHILYRSNLF